MRVSEILGLQWGDLDLDEALIHLRRGIVVPGDFRTEDSGKQKTPSNSSGTRGGAWRVDEANQL